MTELQQSMEIIHQGRHTDVYRTRLPGGRRVVAKALRGPHPSEDVRAAFEREIALTRRVVGEGVIDLVSVDEVAGLPRMFIEDFGGHSLAIAFRHARPEISLVLSIARELVKAMGAVHRVDVVHKDINPSNIVWNAQTGRLALIDFGISTETASEEGPSAAQRLEGTLRYLAPEQTGRLAARIDRRADYYALGATLYQLLVGEPPFVEDDSLSLLHAHLAKVPVAPHVRDGRIPRALSDVVLKLLQKRPDDRYQSLEGLDHDLARCEAIVSGRQSDDGFVAGAADASRDLTLSRELYGRDEEVRVLTRAARRGEASMVLVSGSGGVGKTRLIEGMWRQLAGSRMAFGRGKFEQFARGRSHSALIDGLESLGRDVLSDDDFDEIRHAVVEALGTQARAITELVPTFEAILGRTAPLKPAPPEEAERRLHRALVAFFDAFCARRPLTLILDDLQWADGPSLRLLEELAKGVGRLVVVGTFRPEEVGPEHGLTRILSLESPRVQRIALRPLKEKAAYAFVHDTLQPTNQDPAPLVQLALRKTQGNPFYLGRFLHALERNGVLRFRYPQGWRWDLEGAEALPASTNVVEFMVGSLEALPAPCRDALQAAAVVGDRFMLSDVAALSASAESDVRRALQPAVRSDLVVAQRGSEGGGLRFAHDRIRQAAVASTNPARSAALHAAMGRRLRARSGASLFDVVHHFNAAGDELSSTERRALADLNLEAGRAALRASAFAPALRFFESGLRFFESGPRPFDGDAHDVDVLRALRFGAAEAAYLAGDAIGAESSIATLLADGALEPLAKARALRIRMRLAVSQGELTRAVDSGVEALATVGVSLPANPSKLRVAGELGRARLALGFGSPAARRDDPIMRDATQIMAMELLAELAPPAYIVRQELLPVLGCAMARIAAEHGVGSLASYGYALYALVLSAIGDYGTASKYAELSEALGERFPDDRMIARRAQLLQGFVNHWTRPVRDGLGPLERGFDAGVDSGDLVWGAFCGQMHIVLSFLGGEHLDAVATGAARYTKASEKLQQYHALGMNTSYLRATEHLRGLGDDTDRIARSDELHALLSSQTNNTGLFNFYLLRLMLAVIFDDEGALATARKAAPYIDAVPATYCIPVFLAFEVFAATRRWQSLSASARAGAMSRALVAQARLHRFARLAPANHRSRAALVDAEIARVSGRRSAALSAYDRALAAARDAGQRLDAALAGEFAASFQQNQGNGRLARAYLADAAADYGRWGARRKVELMRQRHPSLAGVVRVATQTQTSTATQTTRPTTQTSTRTGGDDIDALALAKVSRALSEHLVLDELVDALVRITLEISGGTRAVFMDPDGGVRASAATRDEGAPIPERIVQYVRRTQQDLLLGDACERGLFRSDPAIVQRKLRSVLCVPVQHQGELRAILYVEQGELPDAFSERQLEMLRLLTAQAAISLENARLYTNLERSLEAQVKLTTAHARFVPHQFLQALERDRITDVALGDHVEKEMSILFSDIRGFTSIVENLTPAENIAFINDYLAHMEPAIIDHGGFVDSYIGDAIMALFDGPSDDALRAGIAMQIGLKRLNAARRKRGEAPVYTGIGVNTGGLMLGTIGGSTNLKCGVIGDSVNLASRVESLTKHYGCAMLVSGHTKRRLRHPNVFTFRHIERIVPVGTSEPVTIYELLDADTSLRAEKKRASESTYAAAVDAYYERRFSVALQRFGAVLESDPEDAVTQRFVERCTGYLRTGVPDDWDGVVRMTRK
ncbi:MAG: AAA family ATPase [Myxococcota bacterium]